MIIDTIDSVEGNSRSTAAFDIHIEVGCERMAFSHLGV